MMALSEPIECR